MAYEGTGFPNVFDTLLTMQRNYLDLWARAWSLPGRELVPYSPQGSQGSYTAASQSGQQVISVGEERLDVSTRRVYGAATRVKRVVRTKPVERRVELQDETIVVERRRAPDEAAGDDSLTEQDFVMNESREVPVVNKQRRMREVVVLRKQPFNRVEVIREMVREADVEIEQPSRTMVVVAQDETEERQQREQDQRRDADKQQQSASS